MRLALIAIGNTHTQGAIWVDGHLNVNVRVSSVDFLSQSESHRLEFLFGVSMSSQQFDAVYFTSVHPTQFRSSNWNEMNHESPWGFQNKTLEPSQVGLDRLLALEGALSIPEAEAAHSIAVLDTGTAWTWNLLARANSPTSGFEFLGGAIFPGIEAARQGLESATPRLTPSLTQAALTPPVSHDGVGNHTVAALESGFYLLYVASIQTLLSSFSREGAVILTGGNADWLYPLVRADHPCVRHEPQLVLKGMAQIALREHRQSCSTHRLSPRGLPL